MLRSRFPSLRPILLVALALPACGRGDAPLQSANDRAGASREAPKIDPARMRADIMTLASDAYAGRYSLERTSIERAARYVAEQYRLAGLAPVGDDYLWWFDLEFGTELSKAHHFWLLREGNDAQVATDAYLSLTPGGEKPVLAEVARVPAKGKPAGVANKVAVVTFATTIDAAATSRISEIAAAGASAIIAITPDGSAPADPPTALLELSIPVLVMSAESAASHLPAQDDAALKVSLARILSQQLHQVPNVMAMIPGSERPEEIVVVGAHYDHIGTTENGLMCRPPDAGDKASGDMICNGADDNASGSAMLLEIARAFGQAQIRPARTIVFAHFAGEELGLHGSEALANRPPAGAPFASGRVVAMLNLDMVGRYGKDGLSIGAVSSSPAWQPLLESVVPTGLAVTYDESVSSRSDHASFYHKQIPVLFFFTGLHDDYHRTSDHVDKLNLDAMTTIGQLVSDVVFRVAQGAAVPFAAPGERPAETVSTFPGEEPVEVTEDAGQPEHTH